MGYWLNKDYCNAWACISVCYVCTTLSKKVINAEKKHCAVGNTWDRYFIQICKRFVVLLNPARFISCSGILSTFWALYGLIRILSYWYMYLFGKWPYSLMCKLRNTYALFGNFLVVTTKFPCPAAVCKLAGHPHFHYLASKVLPHCIALLLIVKVQMAVRHYNVLCHTKKQKLLKDYV